MKEKIHLQDLRLIIFETAMCFLKHFIIFFSSLYYCAALPGIFPKKGRSQIKLQPFYSKKVILFSNKSSLYTFIVKSTPNPTHMKQFLPLLVALCCPIFTFCQDITGLWKGTMFNDSTQKSSPYEMVISKENGKHTGYSHSWFIVDGKEYYGVKKIKVRVAKDGKIVIQDAELIENNYPGGPDKNVYQLNVLDLANSSNETTLQGPFVTNRTKFYTELTGSINVKRVSELSGSELMSFLQKNGMDKSFTAVK
jgi:hypothetical protein